MKKRVALILAALTIALCILPMSAMAQTMYVKSANGKSVHVRTTPITGTSNVICDIPYGGSVNVTGYLNSTWAIVTNPVGSGECYMMAKFLVSYYPGAYVPTTTTTGTATDASFSSFKQVEEYTVSVKTARSGAIAKLRWAPSKSAALMQTLYAGSTVTVLAEGKDWYQVRDENTGKVGFLNVAFINK